jgi:Putative peptidoglycan binding domain/Glycosyl hydrolase family 46
MGRALFAQGAKGDIIRQIQAALNIDPGNIDGIYGSGTARAVSAFQQSNGTNATGEVDTGTWAPLIQAPIPSTRDRCLQLTEYFEGNGFTKAEGNFDGAGITWGIIGYTLVGGELGKIFNQIEQQQPGLIRSIFGDQTDQLLQVFAASKADQIAFANSISLGATKEQLAEPWLSAFRKLGEQPAVQQLQIDEADTQYFQPALAIAQDYGLTTEMGLALAFDIMVQDGGLKSSVREQIETNRQQNPPANEQDLRVIIANAVADHAVTYPESVRKRKLAIATGSGVVNGEMIVVGNWGLGEFAFATADASAA